MKRLLLPLILGLLGILPAAATPVQIALKPSAAVLPDGDGFFPLAGVASLTGGDDALRARLGRIEVGRAPFPGDVRHLTRGDLALKLRQAGFQPGRDAVLDGADTADVTVAIPSLPSPIPPIMPGMGEGKTNGPSLDPLSSSGGGRVRAVGPPPVLIHRGDIVTIRIDDSDISITAKGTARDGGAVGDTIHVHRDDCPSDLAVTVMDAQTVQLEP